MKLAAFAVFPSIILAAGVAFAQQYEVRHVQGNIYMFASTLGNVTIQTGKDPGHDGVLLVDTGPPELRDALLAEIRKLSDEPVRFLVNTSGDPDHLGSNAVLLKPPRLYQGQSEVALFAQDINDQLRDRRLVLENENPTWRNRAGLVRESRQ